MAHICNKDFDLISNTGQCTTFRFLPLLLLFASHLGQPVWRHLPSLGAWGEAHLTPTLPLNHWPLPSRQPFPAHLGGLPWPPRKPQCVSNKSLHILLVFLWHHLIQRDLGPGVLIPPFGGQPPVGTQCQHWALHTKPEAVTRQKD